METILLIEGDPVEAGRIKAALADEYRIVGCLDGCEAARASRRCEAAAIVAALPALASERNSLLCSFAAAGAPVIAVSKTEGTREVVEAMRSGASDFLSATCPIAELKAALRAATRRGIKATARTESPFIGRSAPIREVAATLALFAASDYPVLILGESGTGKEIAAHAIRELSSRRTGPFVALNCAALPEQLAESELFGTERGAFTDAVARPGAFELAYGGILFLDEIGEAGKALQAKLLRVLESGEYWRLGAKTASQVDLRLVSASGVDLRDSAAAGAFRADLLYRIDTLILELPPLRARREDIAELAEHFALCASRGHTRIGSSARDKLTVYDWPGNVRELRNVVHRAVVLAGTAEVIEAKHVVF